MEIGPLHIGAMTSGESRVMTNDADLCSDDERWKQISYDMTREGTHYPGESEMGTKLNRKES